MRVMRLAPGDRVRLFDGRGAEVEAELLGLETSGATAKAVREVSCGAESPLRTVLLQAVPVKLARMDVIVRQATELGAQRVVPVLSERSQTPRGGIDVVVRRAARWRRVAETAAKQSLRSVVPVIDDPTPWAELDWARLPHPALMLDAGTAGSRIRDLGAREVPDAVTVLVGPEGGWSEPERQQAVSNGAVQVCLGRRILRADSAGAVALAVLQHLWGDLR